MVTDDFGYTFFRGEFECQLDRWMLTRNFWLGFPRDTDSAFLFRILSDERFVGNLPTLSIEESLLYPECMKLLNPNNPPGFSQTRTPRHSSIYWFRG